MNTKNCHSTSQVDAVQATIMKWGNSQGIRIPRSVLKKVNLKENDRIEIFSTDNEIIIRKKIKFNNLTERLEAFYGKSIDEIPPFEEQEVDWGASEGEEFW